jgi:hypothetical protein
MRRSHRRLRTTPDALPRATDTPSARDLGRGRVAAAAALAALAAVGCTGQLRSSGSDGGGPIVTLDAGESDASSLDGGARDAGPLPADAGDGGPAPADLGRPDLGSSDPCAMVRCGAGERCDPATARCVCSPGFVSSGGGCVAAPPGDPETRTAEEMCARWRDDRIERATTPWVAGATMCDPGSVPADAVEDTLRRVNLYRWLTGLPPVTEAEDMRAAVQSCALLMSVNGALDHSPPTTWTCYTAEGAAGAASSNLSLGSSSAADGIDLFMVDRGVPSLGHRRWILNGPLGRVGIGYARRGSGASCLGVFDRSGSSSRDWTAYPNAGFAPRATAGADWSFHSNRWSLDTATVTVERVSDGAALPVTVMYPPTGYGPNTVSWRPMGWTPAAGERYRVTIAGGPPSPVSYEVELVDC